jgi:ribosomal protein L11 methyltransferase
MFQNENSSLRKCLDIGTGSGVLAIAAVSLGLQSAVGVDIDAVACHEARNNVALNGYDREIQIADVSLDKLPDHSFDLIMANLRPPTLVMLVSQIVRLSASKAFIVLTGFRRDEDSRLLRKIVSAGFSVIWQGEEAGWAAKLLRAPS